jgi:glycosyltransferase involved in cell wall biosynthesis
MKLLISANVVWWNASAYHAVTTAQALAARGHDVTFLAHHSTPAFEESQNRGLRTVGDFNFLAKNPLDLLGLKRSLRRFLEMERFDLINPHRPEDHFWLARANQRVAHRAKLVRTVSDVRIPSSNILNRILHEKWTAGLLYCAECCRRRYHQGQHLFDKPEAIIYSALNVEAFRRGNWQEDNPFLIFPAPRLAIIARLSPNKGHRTVLEATAVVRREIPTATFIIAGKEEEVKVADLREYTQHLQIEDGVHFAGYLGDPRPLIAATDVGIIASTDSEVISRAAQEFFAFGVPVVASRVNVLPEMVEEGVNGLLFSPGNAAELAAALLTLIKDEDLRSRCGERALACAKERHDLRVLGERTEEFFNCLNHRLRR